MAGEKLEAGSADYKAIFRDVETSPEFKNMVASNIALGKLTDNPKTTDAQQQAASDAQDKATSRYIDKLTGALKQRGYGQDSLVDPRTEKGILMDLNDHARKFVDAAMEAGNVTIGQETGADGKAALCVKSAQNKGQCR